ncbi:DUF1642 domain-containing protein [Enterococcus faecium]|nr:DUF1642 domain-containing protein [Enterococcus faecium]NTP81983.1 DUF1642 domain-containing protein [Enterococcus faecium]
MNKQELIDKYTAEISRLRPYCPNRHLISEQLKYDLYKEILEDLKQLDEPQKPVIPQLVAGWLEKSTDPFTKAEKIAYLIKSKDGDSYYFCDWFVRDGIVTQEQGEELLAWVTRQSYETLLSLYNGYEVEKEPLYMVPLLTDKEGNKKILVERRGEYDIIWDYENEGDWHELLTEEQIKSVNPDYWKLAVLYEPSEEVEEG